MINVALVTSRNRSIYVLILFQLTVFYGCSFSLVIITQLKSKTEGEADPWAYAFIKLLGVYDS